MVQIFFRQNSNQTWIHQHKKKAFPLDCFLVSSIWNWCYFARTYRSRFYGFKPTINFFDFLPNIKRLRIQLTYTEMNGARTYENYNITLSAQNVLELENIPETVNRDSSFISRKMSMLFAKHEMMNSNVSENNSSNPKLNHISQSPLDKNKKNFIVKCLVFTFPLISLIVNFTIIVSRKLANTWTQRFKMSE
jgi:hypothetical protein